MPLVRHFKIARHSWAKFVKGITCFCSPFSVRNENVNMGVPDARQTLEKTRGPGKFHRNAYGPFVPFCELHQSRNTGAIHLTMDIQLNTSVVCCETDSYHKQAIYVHCAYVVHFHFIYPSAIATSQRFAKCSKLFSLISSSSLM